MDATVSQFLPGPCPSLPALLQTPSPFFASFSLSAPTALPGCFAFPPRSSAMITQVPSLSVCRQSLKECLLGSSKERKLKSWLSQAFQEGARSLLQSKRDAILQQWWAEEGGSALESFAFDLSGLLGSLWTSSSKPQTNCKFWAC